MPDPIFNEGDLLRRMWSGDEEAFVAIYRKYQGAVYRFALQMTGETHTAEDITQEVFLLLMRGPGQYDSRRGSLAGFLYGITRNFVRRRIDKDRGEDVSIDFAGDLPDLNEDALGDLTRMERIEALRQAVLSLTPAYREVVVLCELHEMDYAAAAVILQCPIGTVRSRLHRARARLVEKLRSSERCPAC